MPPVTFFTFLKPCPICECAHAGSGESGRVPRMQRSRHKAGGGGCLSCCVMPVQGTARGQSGGRRAQHGGRRAAALPPQAARTSHWAICMLRMPWWHRQTVSFSLSRVALMSADQASNLRGPHRRTCIGVAQSVRDVHGSEGVLCNACHAPRASAAGAQ